MGICMQEYLRGIWYGYVSDMGKWAKLKDCASYLYLSFTLYQLSSILKSKNKFVNVFKIWLNVEFSPNSTK